MRTRKFLSALIPALPMLLTALLVILVTVILLATMRSKAHAQFGGVEQPMFASLSASTLGTCGTVDPSGENTLSIWWRSSTLPVGASITSNFWYDCVQNKRMRASSVITDNWYTNTAAGMYGWRALGHEPATNELFSVDTNHTVCVITYPEIGDATPRLLFGPWSLGDAVQNNTNTHGGISFEDSAWNWGTDFTKGPKMSSAVALNTWTDVLLVQSPTQIDFYTNGVLSKSFARGYASGGYPWQYTLEEPSAAPAFMGKVRDIMVWTNGLGVAGRSNVHYYATNTYSYTP